MAKARPDRIRFTLLDDTAGSTPLELAPRRMGVAALIVGILFAIFAAVAWGTIARMSLHEVRGVFDLMFWLFHAFWVLGWSVGVFILGALTVLLLFYRESARIQEGRLVYVPRLGPLRIVCEYELARIANVRLEEAKEGDKVRVRFDYDGSTSGIGDAMPRAEAERIAQTVKAAAQRHAKRVNAPETVRTSGEDKPSRLNEPVAQSPMHHAPKDVLGTRRKAGDSRIPASGYVLIGANMLPLIGVMLFDWSLAHVVVLYWAESAVIAFYTVLKICIAGKATALIAVPFFVGHFGGFMAGHFLFVYALFVRGLNATGPEPAALEALIDLFGPLWISLLALAVSHGVSFALNFVVEREYEGATVSELMTAPYKRIMVMHLTVIFGGALLLAFKTPMPALLLLVLLKTAADFRAHTKEHMHRPARLQPNPA